MACVVSLLSHGADMNNQQYSGLSALHLSVEFDQPAVLSLLLEAGALINIRNDFGITLLFLAAHYGRLECLNIILQHLLKTGNYFDSRQHCLLSVMYMYSTVISRMYRARYARFYVPRTPPKSPMRAFARYIRLREILRYFYMTANC